MAANPVTAGAMPPGGSKYPAQVCRPMSLASLAVASCESPRSLKSLASRRGGWTVATSQSRAVITASAPTAAGSGCYGTSGRSPRSDRTGRIGPSWGWLAES